MNNTAIVILNYQNYEDTIECVESIQRYIHDGVDIIVIDNNSSNNSVEVLSNRLNGISKLIVNEKNLGYAGGNNIGIRYAYAKKYEYICILNNDTIVNGDFIFKLKKYMEEHPECAIVGPAILEYNSNNVQSVGGEIDFWKAGIKLLRNGAAYNILDKTPQHVEWVGGACLLFRREIIDRIGYIPECYFLFFEETEWCCRARREGMQVVCYADVYIYHKASISINKIHGLSFYLMERNRIQFVLRNANTIQKIVSISRLFLIAMVKLVLGRPMAKESIKCYLDGLMNRISPAYSFVIIN